MRTDCSKEAKTSGEVPTVDKESGNILEAGNSNPEVNLLSQREKRDQSRGVETGNEVGILFRTKLGFENGEADLWIICRLNISALC